MMTVVLVMMVLMVVTMMVMVVVTLFPINFYSCFLSDLG